MIAGKPALGRRLLGAFAALAALAALAGAPACGDRTAGPPPEEKAALGGEVAARVGAEVIPVSLVAKVAIDQGVPPREALRRLVDDAVAAHAARARGLDHQPPAPWLLTAARARSTADRLMAEARQAGPPTEDELKALTLLHWREVDRPPAVRVVHALAQRPKKDDKEAIARARAVAEELRTAVLSAKDADEFQAKARAVPHPDVDVVVQPLPAFASDGWVTENEGQMDEKFAAAAHALTRPGETSGIVETPFGWHVIRLVELLPEQRMSLEGRRVAFAEEAFTHRARKATEARVAAARAASPVTLSPSAEQLMQGLFDRAERGPPP